MQIYKKVFISWFLQTKIIHLNGGVRIKLKSLDDGYSAVKATQAASSAVSSAQAFLSCFGSPSCLAQQQICAKAKVPLLGPVAGSSALRGKQAWYTS